MRKKWDLYERSLLRVVVLENVLAAAVAKLEAAALFVQIALR